MTHRSFLKIHFSTEAGDDIDLDIEASLIPARPAAYGQPAEPEEVEIHNLTWAGGKEIPSWLDAQIERSDGFSEQLLEALREDLRITVEDREPAFFDL